MGYDQFKFRQVGNRFDDFKDATRYQEIYYNKLRNNTVKLNSYGMYEWDIGLHRTELKGSIFSRNPIESWFSGISIDKDDNKMAV